MDALLFLVFIVGFLVVLLCCGALAWAVIKGQRIVIILGDDKAEKVSRIKTSLKEVELI